MSNTSSDQPLAALSDAMAGAVEIAGASTVLVNGRRRFPASGIAYAPGLIMTASHVLEREDDIPVLLADGQEAAGNLVGRDPGSDLAVLKVEGSLPTFAQPSSQGAKIGQLVMALGRPTPEGIQASLGVVSAIAGPIHTRRGGLLERHLRTDAIPYPGFSGGPLIDAAGQVLGMNTSGLTRAASLAVPVDLSFKIAESLVKHGSVKRGFLGVRSQPVDIPQAQESVLDRDQNTGLLLVGVEKGSPAESGGLMVGDIIVGFVGAPLTEPDDLLTRLTGEIVGNPASVEILRGGQLQEITVTIGERK